MRKLGKFKALKRASKYKDLEKYLDAIYRNNKELIDSKVLRAEDVELATNKEKLLRTSKRTAFKNMVKEYMDEGYNVDEAIKKLSNSRNFTEYEELAHNNMLEALKNDKDAYRKFRELTKEKGRYTKIDMDKFSYIRNNEYIYGNIIVSFKNSPQEIVVRKI